MLNKIDFNNYERTDLNLSSMLKFKTQSHSSDSLKSELMRLKVTLEDIIVGRFQNASKVSHEAKNVLEDMSNFLDEVIINDFPIGVSEKVISNLNLLLNHECVISSGVLRGTRITLRPDDLYIDYIFLLPQIHSDFISYIDSFKSLNTSVIRVFKPVDASEYEILDIDLESIVLVPSDKVNKAKAYLKHHLDTSIVELIFQDGSRLHVSNNFKLFDGMSLKNNVTQRGFDIIEFIILTNDGDIAVVDSISIFELSKVYELKLAANY